MSATNRKIEQLQSLIDELRSRIDELKPEESSAHEAVATAEGAWRAALADERLGEGKAGQVKATRSSLDKDREALIGIEGAVAELSRRLAAAEVDMSDEKMAALITKANTEVCELGSLVDQLLALDIQAGQIGERAQALMASLRQVREEYADLDPEGRSPGIIPDLGAKLFGGLATPPSGMGNRSNLLILTAFIGGFESEWRRGPRPTRELGIKAGGDLK